MTSLKQITANKENAKKSTGPISEQGKAIVSVNATKHGILSNVTVLPDEDENRFKQFKKDMMKHLDPVNAAEELFVDRIISCAWRLRRSIQIENFFLQDAIPFNRYNPVAKIAESFSSKEKTLNLVSRYEVSIERSMYKALHELQKLKALEKGLAGAAPLAMDLDISIE